MSKGNNESAQATNSNYAEIDTPKANVLNVDLSAIKFKVRDNTTAELKQLPQSNETVVETVEMDIISSTEPE